MTQPPGPPLPLAAAALVSPPGDMTGQILVELGKISAQIAVMTEQMKAVTDHEARLRALERFRFTIVGAAVAISVASSAVATWIGIIVSHHH